MRAIGRRYLGKNAAVLKRVMLTEPSGTKEGAVVACSSDLLRVSG